MTFFICVELEWFHCRKFHTNRTLHHWSFIPSAQYGRIRLPYESEELAVLVSARERIGGRGYFCRGWRETDKSEFYCLPFFSNSILTPIVAQTMRSMIGIDKPLFSLPINIAINSNIRETEYRMIIALFFIIKLSVD